MSYTTRVTGEFDITPPLSYKEFAGVEPEIRWPEV